MSTHPRGFRYLVGAIAALAVAATSVLLGPVAAASATSTSMAIVAIPAVPSAGQQVTMRSFVIASDGTTPAGSVNVRVEGFSFIVGGPINTATHEQDANIGNFLKGTIVVDATFTPTNPLYSPTSARTTVNIAGLNTLSLRPVFPSHLVVGTPAKVSVLMSVGSGTAFPPGGVVGFALTGTVPSIGTCTPAATGSARNFSCSATLPAPTKAGPYSITATFGRSEYYNNTSGTTATTVAAKPVIKKKSPPPTKKSVVAPTPRPTATSKPATGTAPTPSDTPTESPTTAPVTKNALATAPKTAAADSSPAGPWEWLFLGALVLLIAATIVILVVLRRRRATT